MRQFEGLLSGEVGGNLLSKYSMLGRFFVTPEALESLRRGIEIALGDELGRGERELLDSVIGYLGAVPLEEYRRRRSRPGRVV